MLKLISYAKKYNTYLAVLSPDTLIIWSDILARTQYKGAESNAKMEVARKRYIAQMNAFVWGLGDKCIRHPGIN